MKAKKCFNWNLAEIYNEIFHFNGGTLIHFCSGEKISNIKYNDNDPRSSRDGKRFDGEI